MSQVYEEFEKSIRKQASVFEIGGFRPPDDPLTSWFGKVKVALPGESWPVSDGTSMIPLAQINLTELPYIPDELSDIQLITVFIDCNSLPIDTPNGEKWALRVYKDLSALVPIEEPDDLNTWLKAFPMKASIAEKDYPCWEDVWDCPEELDDDYYDLFDNVPGFKIGGWPSLIQSGISWAPWNEHPHKPEYVFQIGTTQKGNWMLGDNGVGYFGRGTGEHKDKWALAWQCY